MKKNEDSIPDFNHVKSSLKEYLDSIEELKNKDKTSEVNPIFAEQKLGSLHVLMAFWTNIIQPKIEKS